jgi:sulfonate transport system ATP-binding protein
MTAQQPPRLRQGIPLAINGLQKAFGQRLVLRDINLHIPAGQFVAIVGRSGCGKSTLMRLLAGLDQPTAGQFAGGQRAPARGPRRHAVDVSGSAPAALEKKSSTT